VATALPLLKCLRTHYERHCELHLYMYFPAENALRSRILHIQSQKFPGGDIPGLQQKCLLCVDPDANFRLARQRSTVPVSRNDR